MSIRYIAIHHAGGLFGDPYRSTQSISADTINGAHRNRTDWQGYHAHRSSLGYYGGYNFFLNAETLEITQFRAIGEETLAQRGYNTSAVSICVGGNYTRNPATGKSVDKMTPRIEQALAALVYKIIDHPEQFEVIPGTTIDIKRRNVHPHRWYQSTTECYGNALDDGWIARVLTHYSAPESLEQRLAIVRKILELYLRIHALVKKRDAQQRSLGSTWEPSCPGLINSM